jgi:Rod binding domain-containing protein
MSISPPTDIVLDVARAADPTRYTEAAARLSRPTAPGEDFATFLKSTAATGATTTAANSKPAAQPTAAAGTDGGADKTAKAHKAYQGFEAMALATMIESAMPDDASSYFGEGTAGSVWKSMLADQMAKQMAERGGVGIAAELARGSQAALVGGGDGTGRAAGSMLVANIERGIVGAILPGADQNSDGDNTL